MALFSPSALSPPLSLSFAFVVENLLEGRLRCLWYLRDYAFALRRYSRSPVRSCRLCRVLTDFHRSELQGDRDGQGASGVFTYNASIKVERRTYVQRTVLLNRERSTVARQRDD